MRQLRPAHQDTAVHRPVNKGKQREYLHMYTVDSPEMFVQHFPFPHTPPSTCPTHPVTTNALRTSPLTSTTSPIVVVARRADPDSAKQLRFCQAAVTHPDKVRQALPSPSEQYFACTCNTQNRTIALKAEGPHAAVRTHLSKKRDSSPCRRNGNTVCL